MNAKKHLVSSIVVGFRPTIYVDMKLLDSVTNPVMESIILLPKYFHLIPHPHTICLRSNSTNIPSYFERNRR